MKGKMALIGDSDCTLIFRSVGVETFLAKDKEECVELLKRIKDEYKIIFITDNFSSKMEETIAEINNDVYPIILTIPSKDGNNGYGMQEIKQEMEKSLGIDILFNEDK
ncbi:MAG: hypothetical protein IJW82_03510 [Clostridia bacterium]|nr:hypothetical protein [Clostridia bacterium]